MNEKEINKIQKNMKISEAKITKKVNIAKTYFKQIKDEEKKKNFKKVFNSSYIENRNILGLIQYFLLMYMEVKHRNYTLIYNIVENIKFNQQDIMLPKSNSLEQKINDFMDMLKNDFVLFKRYVSTKKKNNINTVSQKQNEKNENKDKNKNEQKQENEKYKDIIIEDHKVINEKQDNEENLNNKENIDIKDMNIDINIVNEGQNINEENKKDNNDNNNVDIENIKEDIDNINNNLIENNINIDNNKIIDDQIKGKRALTFDVNINDIINDKDEDILSQENNQNIDLNKKLNIVNSQKDENIILKNICENENNEKNNIIIEQKELEMKNEKILDDSNNINNINLINNENENKIKNNSEEKITEKNNIDNNENKPNEETKENKENKQEEIKKELETEPKKEMLEKTNNNNPITSNTKKGFNILKNPKFLNLANMMKEKLSNAPIDRNATIKKEPVDIITRKENPNELIMNKPFVNKSTFKKKPKKRINFSDD